MLVDVVVQGVQDPESIVPVQELEDASLAAENPVEEGLFSSSSSSSSSVLPLPAVGKNRLRLDFLKSRFVSLSLCTSLDCSLSLSFSLLHLFVSLLHLFVLISFSFSVPHSSALSVSLSTQSGSSTS